MDDVKIRHAAFCDQSNVQAREGNAMTLFGRRVLAGLVCASGLAVGATGRADTLRYSYVETDGPETISFVLPSSPTVGGFEAGFQTAGEFPITVDGVSRPGFLIFLTSAYGGGFDIDAGITEGNLQGPQLFSGITTSPTMLVNSFELSGYLITVGHGTVPRYQSGVLTVTDLDAPGVAPEPPSLVLLGTALMGLAGVMYSRKKVNHAA